MIKKLFILAAFFSFTYASAQQSVLERRIQGTGGQLNDTLDNGTVVTLDLSTDDAEQENDEVDSRFDDDLDVGWEGEPADQNILNLGLRFRDLNLVQGSSIDSAFVIFHAHEGKNAADVAQITIYGEATDNAATFDSVGFNDNYLLTDRPRTSASVAWTVAEDWTIWQPYKTADIGPIIQEIVNRPGWQSGNAIALLLLGQDQGPSTVENAREFNSFENIADPDDVDPQGNPGDGRNHPERRPELVVYVNGPLGAEEISIRPLQLYPNPVKQGEFKIELGNDAAASAELYDITGQMVRQYELNKQVEVLSVEGLRHGIYTIKVTQGRSVYSHKLIIE